MFFLVERGRWRRSCRMVARIQFSKSETRELVCVLCDIQIVVDIESRWDFSSVWVWFKDCFVCFFWANTNFLVETSAGKLTPLFSNFSTTPNLQKSQFQHLQNENPYDELHLKYEAICVRCYRDGLLRIQSCNIVHKIWIYWCWVSYKVGIPNITSKPTFQTSGDVESCWNRVRSILQT